MYVYINIVYHNIHFYFYVWCDIIIIMLIYLYSRSQSPNDVMLNVFTVTAQPLWARTYSDVYGNKDEHSHQGVRFAKEPFYIYLLQHSFILTPGHGL